MRSLKIWLNSIAMILLWCIGSACAHPFHISSAEVEFNPKTDRLQVSLKLQAIDFEQALSKMIGERSKLDQDNAEELIVVYLARHFYLTPSPATADQAENTAERPAKIAQSEASGEDPSTPDTSSESAFQSSSRVHWVGRELKGAWLWLYFELELPPARDKMARDDLQLVNTVLCECNAGQINTVSIRHAGQRATLKMTSQQPSEKFLPLWMTP
ncbi:MAG: DUF6702 family protein [Aureliella sp.]